VRDAYAYAYALWVLGRDALASPAAALLALPHSPPALFGRQVRRAAMRQSLVKVTELIYTQMTKKRRKQKRSSLAPGEGQRQEAMDALAAAMGGASPDGDGGEDPDDGPRPMRSNSGACAAADAALLTSCVFAPAVSTILVWQCCG
jgi:hypothetical protein